LLRSSAVVISNSLVLPEVVAFQLPDWRRIRTGKASKARALILRPSDQVVNCVLLKSDMVSHPGNSGGPVVNERGELVGIHCAAADGDKVSYAVSLKEVQAVLAKTRENVRAGSRQRE
jgi:S1-C subfamily serine protease